MISRKTKVLRCFFWIQSFCIMGLIFFMSSQNGSLSGSTSGSLIRFILEAISAEFRDAVASVQDEIIASWQYLVRKTAHFTVYAALGYSLFSAFYTYRIGMFAKMFWPLFIGLSYAASDEYHQTFVEGRAGMIEDVFLDFTGVAVGTLLTLLIVSVYNLIRSRRNRKMRKKELMNKLFELVNTVESLNTRLNLLKEENEELKRRLETATIPDIESSEVEPVEIKEPEGFSVKIVEEISLDRTEEVGEPLSAKKPEPELSDRALEYGASTIGKITIESAKYCDIITSNGSADARELLALVMGKSEVAKNDILGIALSSISYDSKVQMIDTMLSEATDYFKSILEQN